MGTTKTRAHNMAIDYIVYWRVKDAIKFMDITSRIKGRNPIDFGILLPDADEVLDSLERKDSI